MRIEEGGRQSHEAIALGLYFAAYLACLFLFHPVNCSAEARRRGGPRRVVDGNC